MTPDILRMYLRKLQEDKYSWPNDYFAWEKPDGTHLMLGIRSGYYLNILKREFEPRVQRHTTYLYGVDPQTVYYHYPDPNKPAVIHDPIETLVEETSQYRYLGAWRDPDQMMDSSIGRVLAHGRFELALSKIRTKEQTLSLDELVRQAEHTHPSDNKGSQKEVGVLHDPGL